MEDKTKHPYLPKASFEDICAYRFDDPKTFTASPIVNAFAEALHKKKNWTSTSLANYLGLDSHKLSCALQIETGMSLQDIVMEFKLIKTLAYIDAHPELSLSQIAADLGFSSRSALWRFLELKAKYILEKLRNR